MQTRAHTLTDIQKLIFDSNLFLLTMLVSFMYQMSKESFVALGNVLIHALTNLKQYEQLPENYNSNFKVH